MLNKLKANAAAAASAGYASAQNAAAMAKERAGVAAAAKKMVDDGGQPMAEMLLAKKGSADAIVFDQKLVMRFSQAVEAYEGASCKMSSASRHVHDESPPFEQLGKDYNARWKALKSGLAKLQTPIPAPAAASAVEKDAIKIVFAKTKATDTKQSIAEKMSKGSKAEGDADELASQVSTISTMSWTQRVRSKARAAADATKERVEVAKSAKRMVDEGGPEMAEKLLAKKASMDATSIDEKNVLQLQEAIEAYESAVQKMKDSIGLEPEESPTFSQLIKDYQSRSQLLQSVQSGLPPLPEVASVSAEEKDAILYLLANNKVAGATFSVVQGAGKLAGGCAGPR
eukprot:gnl/TRDRNA2_/TRDRNA2_36910_c0_seq1.p1 gnl/TRDRNA2_/TRDRNA2_36910_c0~~gnl/TRDRNA2_/TRDRNA2_36910_c0_seq1.p1  ORF type:complete len:342 (+),score=89.43 gnl/TRDRNA2_/TRDRNA2_36910_c0_seq1:87-1112(+)